MRRARDSSRARFLYGGKGNRGDSRSTLVDEAAGMRLVHAIFPQRLEFPGDAVERLVQRGLYENTRALRKARRARQGDPS